MSTPAPIEVVDAPKSTGETKRTSWQLRMRAPHIYDEETENLVVDLIGRLMVRCLISKYSALTIHDVARKEVEETVEEVNSNSNNIVDSLIYLLEQTMG